jgi:putative ABC transport system permease protein
MALGAQASNVIKLILRQGLILTLIGGALGLLGAFGLALVLSSLLTGVSASDPWIFIGGSAMVVLVTLMACYIPARRAARVDPTVALKSQ